MDEWLPNGAPTGTVLLVHGAGGNGRILAPIAQLVCDMGWRVLSPDLPGYGLTEIKHGFDWDYNEWPKIIAAIAENEPGKKALLGMSVGGLTAVYAAQLAANISGVFVTTLLDMNDKSSFIHAARWKWLGRLSLLGFKLMGPTIDKIRLPLRLAAPLGKMSEIDELADYFKTDDLIANRWVPVRFFRTMHEKKLTGDFSNLDLWLVHPGADIWTPTAMSLKVLDQLDCRKTFAELSNGGHLPAEQPAFNELKEKLSEFLESIQE